jgi:hypothetical protein
MREVPAHWDLNAKKWVQEPAPWDGEWDMPRDIWYRQLVAQTGKPIEQVRREYDHLLSPRAVIKEEKPNERNGGRNVSNAGGAGVAPQAPRARARKALPLPGRGL